MNLLQAAMGALLRLDERVEKSRPFGPHVGSALRTVVRRRVHRFSFDADGDWVNAQSDGVLVSPTPHRTDLRRVRAAVSDYWFMLYTPRPGDVVFDVGAGIGEDTLVFDELVRPAGRVYAFEANPRTARCLEKTARANNLRCLEAFAVAVAEASGIVSIADDEAHIQNSMLFRRANSGVEVRACSLDDFVESRGVERIDLLKMNIEGAERGALLGFQRHFDRVLNASIACHDFIADLGYGESFRTRAFAQTFLEKHGFTVYRRDADKRPWIRDTLLATRSPR